MIIDVDGKDVEVPDNFFDLPYEEQAAIVEAKLAEQAVGGLGANEAPALPSVTDQEQPLDAPSLVETAPTEQDLDPKAKSIVDKAYEWSERFAAAIKKHESQIIEKGNLETVEWVKGDPKEAVVPYVFSVAIVGGPAAIAELELPPEVAELFAQAGEAVEYLLEKGADILSLSWDLVTDDLLIAPIGVMFYLAKVWGANVVAGAEQVKLEQEWEIMGLNQPDPRENPDINIKKERLNKKSRTAQKLGDAIYLKLKKVFGKKAAVSAVGAFVSSWISAIVALLSAIVYRSGIYGAVKGLWDAFGHISDETKLKAAATSAQVKNPFIQWVIEQVQGQNKGGRTQHWSKDRKSLIVK